MTSFKTALPVTKPRLALNPRPMTRQSFLEDVREVVLTCSPGLAEDTKELLKNTKLVYGMGNGKYRGICCYEAWQKTGKQALIEIAASGEESVTQLVGTLIHELGHVLAGKGHGHDATWVACCAKIGLNNAVASGQVYRPEDIEHWMQVTKLERPNDGSPALGRASVALPWVGLPVFKPRPCPLGIGTRGGTSRGTGSGSRLILWLCECPKPAKVRAAAASGLDATCNKCKAALKPVE